MNNKLQPSEIEKIDTKAHVKKFKKGQIIQQEGTSNTSFFYIKKGIVRSYIVDHKGKEHIYMFASEGWITGDIEAMAYNQPTELYIDCLDDCEVVSLNRDTLFKEKFAPEQISENVQLLYRRIGRLQRRILMLMAAPALERYQYFLKTYPELPNRVPQHMIASFLGIAPQTLSTIRSKLVNSH